MPWLLWITHTFSCIDTLHPESWNNITIYYKIYFESIQGSGSCWRFSICSAAKWVVWCLLDFLAQPMFGWLQGDQKKTKENPRGVTSLEFVRRGNIQASRFSLMVLVCKVRQVWWGGSNQMVPWRSSSSTLSWCFILVDICLDFNPLLFKGCH